MRPGVLKTAMRFSATVAFINLCIVQVRTSHESYKNLPAETKKRLLIEHWALNSASSPFFDPRYDSGFPPLSRMAVTDFRSNPHNLTRARFLYAQQKLKLKQAAARKVASSATKKRTP